MDLDWAPVADFESFGCGCEQSQGDVAFEVDSNWLDLTVGLNIWDGVLDLGVGLSCELLVVIGNEFIGLVKGGLLSDEIGSEKGEVVLEDDQLVIEDFDLGRQWIVPLVIDFIKFDGSLLVGLHFLFQSELQQGEVGLGSEHLGHGLGSDFVAIGLLDMHTDEFVFVDVRKGV